MTTTSDRAAAGGTAAARRGPIPIRTWRWLAFAAQALLLLGLPFVRIGGESALRLDVPAGRLFAFGASFAVDEAFVVLAATLALGAAFLLATVLLGRAWCGWACPQTVLGELTVLVEPARGARARPLRRAAGFALVAAVAAVVGASLTWFLVPPGEFLARLAAGRLGAWVGGGWAVGAGVLFLDLAFLRQRFCATACPYAKLQGVLFDRHTLVVAYDDRRDADCIDCGACVRACPTAIDIRDGLQMECIACAACVDACEPIMRRLGRAPDLVGYVHGEPGGRRRLVRPATVALAGLTALAVALLVGAVRDRPLVAVTVSADPAFAPRRAAGGRAVNAFDLVLESRAAHPVDVALALDAGAPGAIAALRPSTLSLAPHETRRLRAVATVDGAGRAGSLRGRLDVTLGAPGRVPERRAYDLTFVVPEPP